MKTLPLRLLLTLTLPLLAGSCAGNGGTDPIPDAQAFLDKMGGPKVAGMEDSMLTMAKDRENVGSYKEAAGMYKQLADKYPDKSVYKIQLADMLRRGGEIDGAVGIYDLVLQKEPDNATAQEGKALGLMQKGAFDQAEPLLASLKASGKGTWRTYNAMGILAAGRQQNAQADENFALALKASPDNPSVLNNIGLSQAINRKFEASFTSFAQAGALATGKPELKKQIDLNSALAYAANNNLDKAEEITKRYYNDAALANNMALYAHLANDDQLAQTYLNMALTQSKTFYQRAWNNLEIMDGNKATARSPGQLSTNSAGSDTKPVLFEPPAKTKIAAEKTTTTKTTTVKTLVAPAAAATPVVVEEKKEVTVITAPAAAIAAPAAAAPAQELTAPPMTVLAPPASAVTAPAETAATPPAAIITPPPAAPAIAAMPEATPAPAAVPSRVQVVTPKKKDADNGFDAIGNWVGGLLD